MTLATLDQLFGPVPPEHEHLERFGYREEKMRGRSYYVGSNDKGRAIVGPVRHRAKGWFGRGFRKSKKTQLPAQERTMKIVINEEAMRRMVAEANKTSSLSKAVQNLRTSLTLPQSPAPQKEPGMFRRIANWCTELWYDEEWHKGARNTAGNILLWSFTAFAVLVFVKGALWVLSM